MDFGRPAEIQHALSQERNDIARATPRLHMLAKRGVGILSGVRLRPLDLGDHAGLVELRGDLPLRWPVLQHDAVAVREEIGGRVAAVIDGVAFEAGLDPTISGKAIVLS